MLALMNSRAAISWFGGAVGGQTRDLRLLRSQLVARSHRPLTGVLAGRLELDPRPLRKRLDDGGAQSQHREARPRRQAVPALGDYQPGSRRQLLSHPVKRGESPRSGAPGSPDTSTSLSLSDAHLPFPVGGI